MATSAALMPLLGMLSDFNVERWSAIVTYKTAFYSFYLSVDFAENQLWINQRDGKFVEVAGDVGADNLMNDMGVALGDPENDGISSGETADGEQQR